MSPRSAIFVAWAALLAANACRKSDTPTEAAPSSDASPGVDATPPPPPALTVENRGPGQFALTAVRAVNVATKAILEKQGPDGQWAALDQLEGGKGYRLIEECAEADPPPCRALGQGDVLVPLPWSGSSCGVQCAVGCDKNPFLSGVHRLIVTACNDAKVRFEGDPFEIPPTERILERQRVAASLVRAAIVRLDVRRGKAGADAGTADRRAGFAVVAGSEKVMEVDGRSELAKWLRNKDGFKDETVDARQGCAQQPAVGFALTSSVAPGKERTAEVAVEFGCNRVTIAREERGHRVVSAASFDPSRAVILGIVGRALPADTEIGRLR